MDGPPGSQGVIQRKGKKNRKNKQVATTADSNQKASEPHSSSSKAGRPQQNPPGSTAAHDNDAETSQQSPLAGKPHPLPLPQEVRDLANPNIPMTAMPLRELYLRATDCSLSAPSGRSHHDAEAPLFATQFDPLPYPRGITNNSNFCFMNSILQALLFIPAFAQLAVSAMPESATCPTLAALGKWMVQYWKPGLTRAPIQPPRLPFTLQPSRTRAFEGRAATVDGSQQQDAQEFLQRMLEVIREELKRLESAARHSADAETGETTDTDVDGGRTPSAAAQSTPSKGWTVVKGREKLKIRAHVDKDGASSVLLDAIFGGTLQSHLTGKSRQRDHASVVVEQFYCLPVDIGFQMECSIESAVEKTMTTERIYDAERDKELKKTLLLQDLPHVLFLHLRRWAVTAEGELVKLDNKVKFGRTLVLPRAVCADDKLSNKARTYRLLSVVAHRGAATGRGHYVTYLAANVANPTNVSAVGGGSSGSSSGSSSGPQPSTNGHGAAPSRHAGGGPAHSQSGPARHPLSSPAQVLLCNDMKTTVCQAADMLQETVYFLVYQRATG